MSFDTEFNYGNVVTGINGYITTYQNQKSNTLQELNILGNLSSEFQSVSNVQIDHFNTTLNCLDTSISRLGNVLNEVLIIQNLPSDSKNVLYDFYQTYVKDSQKVLCVGSEKNKKIHFMRQLVYNTGNIVPLVSNLMSDVSMTTTECECTASIILQKHGARRETRSFIGILM